MKKKFILTVLLFATLAFQTSPVTADPVAPQVQFGDDTVCISTDCGSSVTPRILPSLKNHHDPRFMGPKPIEYRSL